MSWLQTTRATGQAFPVEPQNFETAKAKSGFILSVIRHVELSFIGTTHSAIYQITGGQLINRRLQGNKG